VQHGDRVSSWPVRRKQCLIDLCSGRHTLAEVVMSSKTAEMGRMWLLQIKTVGTFDCAFVRDEACVRSEQTSVDQSLYLSFAACAGRHGHCRALAATSFCKHERGCWYRLCIAHRLATHSWDLRSSDSEGHRSAGCLASNVIAPPPPPPGVSPGSCIAPCCRRVWHFPSRIDD